MDIENPIQHEAPEKKQSKTNIVLVGLVVVLIVINVVLGYVLYRSMFMSSNNSAPPDPEIVEIEPVEKDEIDTVSVRTLNTYTSVDDISWIGAPKPIEKLGLHYKNEFSQDGDYFELGTVNSGVYEGATVVLFEPVIEGPVFGSVYHRLLIQEDQAYFLNRYSSFEFLSNYVDVEKVTDDQRNIYINDLELPEVVETAAKKSNITLRNSDIRFFDYDTDDLDFIYVNADGREMYVANKNSALVSEMEGVEHIKENPEDRYQTVGFILKGFDGIAHQYEIEIDFVHNNIPKVTWLDGTSNTEEYTHADIGGCGFGSYVSVIPPSVIDPGNDLVQIGTDTVNNKPVYSLKNTEHEFLKSVFSYADMMEPATEYEEFLSQHPLFFWEDSFGRLIKFQNSAFIPLAECGKPVIYLYPEEAKHVSVEVEPTGGFTVTEPEYNDGWEVIAKPDGSLTNISDRTQWPYLFWEGHGSVDVPAGNKRGFVVKERDVESFLEKTLYDLGLNAQESADFIEFWEPKMHDAPYYFVTFYGNRFMDAIAPLTVTPEPDTTIRIMMDYKPLDAPIEVEPMRLRRPQRDGFTVIEWGGVLR